MLARVDRASACPALAAAMLGVIALVTALAVDLPDVTASGVTTDLEIGDAEPAAGFWIELVGAVVMTAGAAALASLLDSRRSGAARQSTLTGTPTPMLEALDEAPLTRRFYLLAAAVMVGAVLDLFDFFLIAFVVPDLADEWDLTFGQAAVMLLAAGVGAIGGSIVWGRAGDRLGRRRPLMAGILMFSLATGALALAPDGGWWYIAALRLVVGAGVAGVAVIAVPLALEFTPTRLRTRVVGFVTTAMVPVGIMVAAVVAAALPGARRSRSALLPVLLVVLHPVLRARVAALAGGQGAPARGARAWWPG